MRGNGVWIGWFEALGDSAVWDEDVRKIAKLPHPRRRGSKNREGWDKRLDRQNEREWGLDLFEMGLIGIRRFETGWWLDWVFWGLGWFGSNGEFLFLALLMLFPLDPFWDWWFWTLSWFIWLFGTYIRIGDLSIFQGSPPRIKHGIKTWYKHGNKDGIEIKDCIRLWIAR